MAGGHLRVTFLYAAHTLMAEQPGHLRQNSTAVRPVIPALRLRQEDQKREASLTQLISRVPFPALSLFSWGVMLTLRRHAHCRFVASLDQARWVFQLCLISMLWPP